MRVAKSTLLAISLALLLALAGCNGQSGNGTGAFPTGSVTPDANDSQTTPTPTPTPVGMDVADTRPGGRLAENARDVGLEIESIETRNSTVVVRYRAQSREDAVRRGTALAVAYSETVNQTWRSNATWDATNMDAIAVNSSGEPISRYRMMAYWGWQYADEFYDRDELARRLDASLVFTQNGRYPPASRSLVSFGTTIQRLPNVNLTGLHQRGDTVFLAVENNTANRSAYDRRLTNIAEVYGAFVNQSFSPQYVQLEVQDPDGDVEGWYRIENRQAFQVYLGNPNTMAFIRDTYVAENGNLEG